MTDCGLFAGASRLVADCSVLRLPAARLPRPPRLPRPLVGGVDTTAADGAEGTEGGVVSAITTGACIGVAGSITGVVTAFSLLVSETGKLGTKAGTIGAASDGFRGC